MKITLSQSKPKSHTKTILALGAGIAALTTYVASSKARREKMITYAEKLKEKWNDMIETLEIEAEVDADDMKRAAKKVIRKAKTRVRAAAEEKGIKEE